MHRIYLLLPSLLICLSYPSSGQRRGLLGDSSGSSNSTVYFVGLPYSQRGNLFHDLWILNQDTAKPGFLWVECWDILDGDSVLVTRVRLPLGRRWLGRSRHFRYRFREGRDSSWVHPDYGFVLHHQGRLPAGKYQLHTRLHYEHHFMSRSFPFVVDSAFSSGDRGWGLMSRVADRQLRRLPRARRGSALKGPLLAGAAKKYSRRMGKEGFKAVTAEKDGLHRLSIYYKDRLVGHREWAQGDDLLGSASSRLPSMPSRIPLDIGQQEPLFSQFREGERKEKAKDKEMVGSLSMMTHVSDGQEAYGEQENNYYDLSGFLEIPVLGLDLQLEAYYTSQDWGRSAKASYFHWHYDASSAKARLLDRLSRYRRQYEQSSSSLGAMERVYQSPLSQWQGERQALISGFSLEGKDFSVDSTGLYSAVLAGARRKADSLGVLTGSSVGDVEDAARQQYSKWSERWAKLRALESRILQAESLLGGWRQRQVYDSLLAYDGLSDRSPEALSELSYRQLTEKASGLEGGVGWFQKGLQRMDLGIFSHRLSAYTLDGQRLRGADMEYDLGAVDLGFTFGSIAYVDRQGREDRYQGYSGRMGVKSWEGHRTQLLWFGYSPSSSLISSDTFFKEVAVHAPSFQEGMTHIVSVVHRGSWGEAVDFGGELATSVPSGDPLMGNHRQESLAWRFDLGGRIQGAGLEYRGEYEKVGQEFENHTLFMSYRGLERFRAALSGQWFGQFLSWEVDYHHLIQQQFSSTGNLSKWGFSLSTASRRYPRFSLSYKPFTTYRSFADTSRIPLAPILGSVWSGQMSYQWKRQGDDWRFHSLYHRHRSLSDTLYTGGDMAQVQLHYSRRGGLWGLMLGASQMTMLGSGSVPLYGRQRLVQGSGHYQWDRRWQLQLSQELGFRDFGFSRYCLGVGVGYHFSRFPLALRGAFRYQRFRWSSSTSWRSLTSGTLTVQWSFRMKLTDASLRINKNQH